jgi:hypothetical protein
MSPRLRATGIVGGFAMLATGCNRVQNALAPAGDQAAEIGKVWDLMLWICVPL